ncbi:MAG TPA: MarR family transcriptional regulator [Nocardia sp.]|uniref:MarR family winged helix-turn-helix transcriptional regulator n=1 Tax=Nocardia sp. TaxID=1821 RepID=UPI002B4B116C|nr:MarR family transcriptional regulator [Nocardia sp.]HLS79767.1 MarR family transcriptional regulator [Nocardia sp.]
MSTQPTPDDPGQTFRRYLSSIVLHAQAGARAVGLGATDLYALNILELTGPMTPGELGARTGLTTGPTTRLVDRLEQAGYVRRAPDPADRRKVIVEPLDRPAGLDETLTPARRRIADIIDSYSPDQRALLFDYFTRAADAYRQATEEITTIDQQPRAGADS